MHLPAYHGVSCSCLTLLSKQLLPVSTFNGTNQARIVTEEAADAAYPVVMVPLEVTHTALATAEVLARIRAMGSPFADMVRYGCGGVLERCERRRAEAGGPQHPLCVVQQRLKCCCSRWWWWWRPGGRPAYVLQGHV